jgi:hypothetical protein
MRILKRYSTLEKKSLGVERRAEMERPESVNDVTSLDYYAIENLLTDEKRAARDRARRFVQEEVLYGTVVWERAPQSCN